MFTGGGVLEAGAHLRHGSIHTSLMLVSAEAKQKKYITQNTAILLHAYDVQENYSRYNLLYMFEYMCVQVLNPLVEILALPRACMHTHTHTLDNINLASCFIILLVNKSVMGTNPTRQPYFPSK